MLPVGGVESKIVCEQRDHPQLGTGYTSYWLKLVIAQKYDEQGNRILSISTNTIDWQKSKAFFMKSRSLSPGLMQKLNNMNPGEICSVICTDHVQIYQLISKK